MAMAACIVHSHASGVGVHLSHHAMERRSNRQYRCMQSRIESCTNARMRRCAFLFTMGPVFFMSSSRPLHTLQLRKPSLVKTEVYPIAPPCCQAQP